MPAAARSRILVRHVPRPACTCDSSRGTEMTKVHPAVTFKLKATSSYTLSSTPSSHQNLDLGQPPTSEPYPDDVAEEGPRPKKKRREGDSQGTSREEGSSSTSLIDTYSQLAYVLSGLRASTARETSRLGVDQRARLEQAFTCVSTHHVAPGAVPDGGYRHGAASRQAPGHVECHGLGRA